MQTHWLVVLCSLSLAACSASREATVSCGEGVFFADSEARYCTYALASACPEELSHSLPVGEGTVCTDVAKAVAELPPEVCRGLNEPECGTRSEACAAPLPMGPLVCTGAERLGDTTGAWEIAVRRPDGSLVEDGGRVLAGTHSRRLYVPLILDLEPFFAERGTWRCYSLDGRLIDEHGAVVWEGYLGAYLSSQEEFEVRVPITRLGRVTLEVRTIWHDDQVLALERELEIDCAL